MLQGAGGVKKHSQSATRDRQLDCSELERALSLAGVTWKGTLPSPASGVQNGGAAHGSQLDDGSQCSRDCPTDASLPNVSHAETEETDTRQTEAQNGIATHVLTGRGQHFLLQPVLCAWQTPDRQRLYMLHPHAPHSLADLLRFNPSSLADDTAVRLLLYQVHARFLSCYLLRKVWLCNVNQCLLLQVISGLDDLHSSSLWHGWLLPETVLLNSQSHLSLAGACSLPSQSDCEESLAELTARWHSWQVSNNPKHRTLKKPIT